MTTHILERKTILQQPLEVVFDFFSKAENLNKITPPDIQFKILTPSPIEMKMGMLINYKLKLFGVPFYWTTEITEWNPPYSFEDSQIKGPYSLWIHKHTFEEKDGQVHMLDRVEYKSPGWILEPLIDTVFVTPNVKKIFDYRESTLKTLFK